jgi:hypothetical protein
MAQPVDPWRERINLLIRAGISIVVLVCGLYVILSDKYPDSTAKWAYGAIGIVIGYWLR